MNTGPIVLENQMEDILTWMAPITLQSRPHQTNMMIDPRPWRLFARSWHICAAVLLVASCHPIRGCAVSEFRLASESRLPVWFSAPSGVERRDLEVTMTSYSPLFSAARTATFELRTKQGQLVKRVVAQKRGSESLILQPDPGRGPRPYPRYEILTADGKLDVVVHQRLEPFFRMTDDPDVRRRLGLD